MTDKINGREIVLDMLLEVIEENKFSHTVLNNTLKKYQQLNKQDRAFITRLYLGTMKRYMTLDYIINQYASISVQKMKPFIRNILRLSVYQMFYMDQVPTSAVCNEAVKITKKRGFVKLSGFVNGILRNISRNAENVVYPDKEKDPIGFLGVHYSVPRWLVKQLYNQYGFTKVESMLEASLREKEMTIRCNLSKISPDKLNELLTKEGVKVEKCEELEYAFRIREFDYLDKLQTFQQGLFTVQDISSMLVCQIADIKDGDFVVDVCAAPGGKALHAAQKAKSVSARDVSDYKINLIEENVNRLGVTNVETKIWDAKELDTSIVEKADVVIADLPCSGLGVLGKKPDIKYNLTQSQQNELINLQKEILGVVQKYVKKGGVLIFSTCTVNQDENIENLKWFLKEYDFIEESIDPYLPDSLKCDTTKEGHLQLIPGIHKTDGFFMVRMKKQ